jgi:hypothetical protein
MAASTISIPALTDDTGSAAAPNLDGTVLNNSWFQTVFAPAINAMFAGAGAYATFELGGKLVVDGFGAHTFSAGGTGGQTLSVRNTTAGTGNFSSFQAGNDVSATNLYIQSFASSYTTAGPSVQGGGTLGCEGIGGLSVVASHATGGIIRFYTGGSTLRGQIDLGGTFSWLTAGIHSFSASTPVTLEAGCGAAGAGNYAAVGAINNASELIQLIALSTTYATLNYKAADTGILECNLAGGFNTAAYPPYGWWSKPGNAQLMVLTDAGGSNNGLFLKTGLDLHIGSISVVGRGATNPTNAINIFDGVAPSGALINGVTLYSAAGKLWAMDAAGNPTKLTP